MANNRITIDVEARFVDHLTTEIDKATKSSDKLTKSVEKANKELDKTSKKNVKPKLDADDNAFTKKIRTAQSKAEKLGRTKVAATLGAIDKASSKISKVTGKAKAFGSKAYKSTLSVTDKATKVINGVEGAARSFAGRTFRATVKIVDMATSPLRKIKDSLFSIKTLIAAVTAGFAAQQFVVKPINLADQYSSAKIGFSTLLGEAEGNSMMNKLDAFAKATPFSSSQVIQQTQRMISMGWEAENIIEDMRTIGDAAAASGKGEQGLQQIVTALAQIKTKGKLSTEELNQLAEAGISAKKYIAEGLGYGSGDAGIAKMTEDLEDGAIQSGKALQALLAGMKEYEGMMDTTANETVSGLWSQIQDTFEINIFRKWGQGLQDGAKIGFGSIVDLLNTSEAALEDFGDMLYDIGKDISNWGAGKLEKVVSTVKEITATDTWKNASLGDKLKMLWDGVIGNPFSEWWDNTVIPWWDNTAIPWLQEKASGAGEAIGKGLTIGLLALFGADEKVIDGLEMGSDIAGSFAEGFKNGFDGSVVKDAFVDAISGIWDALPTWAKTLLVGYGGGKAISGIGSVIGGIGSIAGGIGTAAGGIKSFVGSTGNAMVRGTGLLSLLASAGYALKGGAATAGGYFGASTAMTGAQAALLGGAGITGGVAAGASAIKGGVDLYKSYKAFKTGDETEGKARAASGGTTLGGVAAGAAAGAAIGSFVPVLGTALGGLLGAGIGGIAGWIGGNKWGNKIREDAETAKFETEAMKDAIKDAEKSAEELALEFDKAVNQNIADHFGEIALTMEEISLIAKKITMGHMAEDMEKFTKATETAKSTLKNMQSASDALDRFNWKMGLGLKLDGTESEEYKVAIDSYIESAKTYVEDKHYEFTAAVTLLMDVSEGSGKSIVDSGNKFYAQFTEKINKLSSELSSKVNIALKDGVITLDENAELINLQNQIATITNKLSEAETEAGLEAIKIKFGKANISDESFAQLQSELQVQMDESAASYENALTVGLTNLNLQFNEGLINEKEYERMKGALEDAFNTQMEELELKVEQLQLNIVGEAYEDVLGEDAVQKLNAGISESLKSGISPAEWTTDDVRKFLNVDKLGEESAAAIASLLSSMEFEPANITADVHTTTNMLGSEGTTLDEETAKGRITVNDSLSKALENPFQANANAELTLNWKILNPTATLNFSGGGGNGSTVSATVGGNAAGGIITGGPQLSWLDEENQGEVVIPFNPSRRSRALKLFAETGRRLGVFNHANGGFIGTDSAPIPTFNGGNGEQNIEINMGGVTIEIKADGNKSVAQNIEEQEQEIAEKVAAIFKNVFSAQFANMPLKGEA